MAQFSSKKTNPRPNLKKRLRDFLGLGADTIQVGQFLGSFLQSGFAKTAVAATLVGGTAYVGTTVVKQKLNPTPIPSPTPWVATAQPTKTPISNVKGAFESQIETQKEIEKVFNQLTGYWGQGNLEGIASVLEKEATEDLAQELQKRYNRILLNWRLFKSVELNLKAAKFSGGYFDVEKEVEVPLVQEDRSLNNLCLVRKKGLWKIKDFMEFLSKFTRYTREVPQDLFYIRDGEHLALEKLKFELWDSYPDNPYSLTLNLPDACYSWEGQVYIAGQAYPDSELNGSSIHLSEAAIYAINQNKLQVIEIRDIVNTSPYRSCTAPQDTLSIDLF